MVNGPPRSGPFTAFGPVGDQAIRATSAASSGERCHDEAATLAVIWAGRVAPAIIDGTTGQASR
ncbi:MAG: hypothetical protein A2Z12_05865 [Actinobacteria bacterium RBG_16_68_21]|nr:MAG: hypothetical protein A2Z12_05865 [Actinobacteria bacterium RBG_16_68_21]